MKSNGGNTYDRVFKENAGSLLIPFLKQYLHLDIKSSKVLDTKLTKTLEREIDFVYQITPLEGPDYLLHIEFQTQDDREMLFRVGEYHALLLRKHKLHIRHVVLYLGESPTKMRTTLPESFVYRDFKLVSLNSIPSVELLSSDVPEILVLSILGALEDNKEDFVRELLSKLSKVEGSSKYIQQIRLLAPLRNLSPVIHKTLKDMPITLDFDIEQDAFYQQGVEKGIEKGRQEERKEVLQKLLSHGIPLEEAKKLLDS